MVDIVRARSIVVLADCHIHPAKGIDWPRPALEVFQGTDLFVTLGDMGERAGLDVLATLAPVIGVRGRDDSDDPRTSVTSRVLQIEGLRLGCVFDPLETGVALQVNPPVWAPIEKLLQVFQGPVDAILWASTHAPSVERSGGRLHLNPGSLTLPSENGAASFATLTVTGATVEGEIVFL
jgi:putative phosphoesterase